MKKLLTILMSLTLILSLAACGGSGSPSSTSTNGSNSGDNSDSNDTSSTQETITLSLGGGYAADHIMSKCYDAIAARIEEASGGTIKVNHYPANQLGDTNERAMMCAAGSLDINAEALSVYDSYNPRQGVVSAFFMFEDWDHYKVFKDSDLYREILDSLEESVDITYVGEVYAASRQIVSQKPINSLADLSGVKMRVPNQEMPIAFVNALGAVAVPLGGNETYTAAQNGTISAIENGAEMLVANAFYEVCPYLTYTNHQIQTICFFISNATRDKLTGEQYQLICDVIKEVTAEYDELSQEAEAEKEAFLEENITCTRIDLSDFRTACESTYDTYDDVWGDGVWEQIRAMAD